MMRWSWLAALLAVGACADEPASLNISVQWLSPSKNCYVTIAADELRASLTDVCDSTVSKPTAISGGGDRLRLVIDYGDVQLDGEQTERKPTVKMTVDGDELDPSASVVRGDGGPDHLIYLATLTAPAHEAKVAYFSVDAAPGLVRESIGPLRIGAPTVTIAPDCSASGCTKITGVGVEPVEVRAPGDAPVTGTLTWTIDGLRDERNATVNLVPAPNVFNELAGTAFVPVPVKTGQWILTAQVGKSSVAAQPITIIDKSVKVVVEDCPDVSMSGAGGMPSVCERTAGIGTARVDVETDGTADAAGVINWSLDGVTESGSVAIPLKAAADEKLVGTAFVSVPNTTGQWVLTAQVERWAGVSRPITLKGNPVSVIVECPGGKVPCALVAGVGTATFDIDVAGATDTTGSVTSLVDGLVQGAPVPVTLTNAGSNQLHATVVVPVPSRRGNWTLRAVANNWVGTSAPITLNGNALTATIQGCQTAPCPATAGVGSVAVEVTADGVQDENGFVDSFVQGVLQPASTPIALKPIADGRVKGVAFVPVPSVRTDVSWALTARVGELLSDPVEVSLSRPTITLAVNPCAALVACSLKAESSAELVVTAPASIRDTQASIFFAVNGVSVSVPTTVTLTQLNAADDTLSATLLVTVPKEPNKTWTIDASVAGYRADSRQLTIIP